MTFPVLLVQQSKFTRLQCMNCTSLGFFISQIRVLDDKHCSILVLIFHFSDHAYNIPCGEMCHETDEESQSHIFSNDVFSDGGSSSK